MPFTSPNVCNLLSPRGARKASVLALLAVESSKLNDEDVYSYTDRDESGD